MFKKYLVSILASFIYTSVWGATLYYNAATDTNWNTLTNWWQDSGFTIQATSLPGISDDVIVSASVGSNTGGNPSINTLVVNGGTSLALNITVANGVTFNNSTRSTFGKTITGHVTFNNSSSHKGIITGNVVFNNSTSMTNSTINGDAIFNDSSRTIEFFSTITGTATFNDTSSLGTFSSTVGTAIFNDSSTNFSNMTGNAIFNDSSAHYGQIQGNADVYYPSTNPIGGSVSGTVTYHGYDTTAPVLSQVTAVTTPTNDTTPAYTFTTNEAGTITYGGSCSSATTSATMGANTISFNTLVDGAYSNCTITVTDAASNVSNVLPVTAFTVDTMTPTISNITSSPLFPPGSAITWTTNEATTSRVEYGLTDSYGSFTTLDSSLVTSHTVNITGLGATTTYHYRVISADAAGNSIVGSDNIFVTANGGGGGGSSAIHEEKKTEKAQEKEIKEEEKEKKSEQSTEKEVEKTQENDVSPVEFPQTHETKTTVQTPTTEVEEFEPFATREKTLSIALKLSGIEVTGMYICQNKFTDTPTPYSCEVAEKSQSAGLISNSRSTFRPERSVTRIEAYSIFMQSVCVAPETNENNWKQLIIKKAIDLGFTERTLETFRPDRAISTSEMFALAKQIGEWKTNNPNSCQK